MAICCASVSGTAVADFQARLIKVELDTSIVAVGETILAKFWWQNVGDAPASEDYRVLVQPRQPGNPERQKSDPTFGVDFAPLPGTRRWVPGRIYFTAQTITLPTRAVSGKYDLLVGLFVRDGARVPLANPHQAALDTCTRVAKIEVLPRGAAYERRAYSATFFEVTGPIEQPRLPEATERTATIRSERLEIILDAARPTVYRYRYLPDGPSLLADIEGVEPDVRLCRLADGLTRHSSCSQIKTHYDARFGKSEATFRSIITWNDQPVGG